MSRAQLLSRIVALSLMMTTANAQSLRSTDELLLAENAGRTQQRIDALHARLVALSPLGYSGDAQREFRYASANAWLTFAFDARAQRDNSTAKSALTQTEKLIELMEAEDFESAAPDPGIKYDSSIASPRLAAIDAMKHDEKLHCAPAQVAKLEVATLQAAHAQRLLGWRHARPYWLVADDLAALIAPRYRHCKVQR